MEAWLLDRSHLGPKARGGRTCVPSLPLRSYVYRHSRSRRALGVNRGASFVYRFAPLSHFFFKKYQLNLPINREGPLSSRLPFPYQQRTRAPPPHFFSPFLQKPGWPGGFCLGGDYSWLVSFPRKAGRPCFPGRGGGRQRVGASPARPTPGGEGAGCCDPPPVEFCTKSVC